MTHDDGTDLWVIDPQMAKVVTSIAIPGFPEAMVYDPSTDRIYLNIKNKDVVAVIDPSTSSDRSVADRARKPASWPRPRHRQRSSLFRGCQWQALSD